MDPSDAAALATEVREPLFVPAVRLAANFVNVTSSMLQNRDPGLRLRTTHQCRTEEHLLDAFSLDDTPVPPKHSMPGCGLVIGRFTTVLSAEFSIAHSTTHLGQKFHVFAIAFDAASPRI